MHYLRLRRASSQNNFRFVFLLISLLLALVAGCSTPDAPLRIAPLQKGEPHFSCHSTGGDRQTFVHHASSAIQLVEGEMRLSSTERHALDWPLAAVLFMTSDASVGLRLHSTEANRTWPSEDGASERFDRPRKLRFTQERTNTRLSMLHNDRVAAQGEIGDEEIVPFRFEFTEGGRAKLYATARMVSQAFTIPDKVTRIVFTCRDASAEVSIQRILLRE